jgi:hypothetical protein
MNYAAQERLLMKLLRRSDSERLVKFLKRYQEKFIGIEYINRQLRIGFVPISDFVIRNLKL